MSPKPVHIAQISDLHIKPPGSLASRFFSVESKIAPLIAVPGIGLYLKPSSAISPCWALQMPPTQTPELKIGVNDCAQET